MSKNGSNTRSRHRSALRQQRQQLQPKQWHGHEPSSQDASAGMLCSQLYNLPSTDINAATLRELLSDCSSRIAAAAFKRLDLRHASQRAFQVFACLRGCQRGDPLLALCDMYTYSTIMSQCPCSVKGVKVALMLLEEMKDRQVHRNTHTYSALIHVCLRADQLMTALRMYQELLNEGLVPNLVTYHTLMDVFGHQHEWERALEVLDLVQQKGLELEVRTFNMAIIACGRVGRATDALHVFEKLINFGLVPCLTTYTALMSLFCRVGVMHQGMLVFQTMRECGIQPNTITYSSLINGCEKSGDLKQALALFVEMQERKCIPSVVTYNTLLRACVSGAEWRTALRIWLHMQDLHVDPDVVTVRALLSVMHFSNRWTPLLRICTDRLPRSVRQDVILSSKILDALWCTGYWDARLAALQMLATLQAENNHVLGPDDAVVHRDGQTTVTTWSTKVYLAGPMLCILHSWLTTLLFIHQPRLLKPPFDLDDPTPCSYNPQSSATHVASILTETDNAKAPPSRVNTFPLQHNCTRPTGPTKSFSWNQHTRHGPSIVEEGDARRHVLELQMKLNMQEAVSEAVLEVLNAQVIALGVPLDVDTENGLVRVSIERTDLLKWFNSPRCVESLELPIAAAQRHVVSAHAQDGILCKQQQVEEAMRYSMALEAQHYPLPKPDSTHNTIPAALQHLFTLTHHTPSSAATFWEAVQFLLVVASSSNPPVSAEASSSLDTAHSETHEVRSLGHSLNLNLENGIAQDTAFCVPPTPTEQPSTTHSDKCLLTAVLHSSPSTLTCQPTRMTRTPLEYETSIRRSLSPRRLLDASLALDPPSSPIKGAPSTLYRCISMPTFEPDFDCIGDRVLKLSQSAAYRNEAPSTLMTVRKALHGRPSWSSVETLALWQLASRSLSLARLCSEPTGINAAGPHNLDATDEFSGLSGQRLRSCRLASRTEREADKDVLDPWFTQGLSSFFSRVTSLSCSANETTPGAFNGLSGCDRLQNSCGLRDADSVSSGRFELQQGSGSVDVLGLPAYDDERRTSAIPCRKTNNLTAIVLAEHCFAWGQVLSDIPTSDDFAHTDAKPPSPPSNLTFSLPQGLGFTTWSCCQLYLAALYPSTPTHEMVSVLSFIKQNICTVALSEQLWIQKPSLLSAALFVCARRHLRLFPEWPQALIVVTGYQLLPEPSDNGKSQNTSDQSPSLLSVVQLVSSMVGLGPFVQSKCQQGLAAGPDAMLKFDKPPVALVSPASDKHLLSVLNKAKACHALNNRMASPRPHTMGYNSSRHVRDEAARSSRASHTR